LFLMTKTTTLCIFHEHPYIFKIRGKKNLDGCVPTNSSGFLSWWET
jgi:hypothetical protein